MGIIPPFVPSIWTTVEVVVAMAGLMVAAIVAKKKKLAKQLAESQAKQNEQRRYTDLAEKYLKEHPEERTKDNFQDLK